MANANIYVSHSGDNTTGASWAHAYTTLATAITNSGTGGTDFWCDSTQNESTASPTYTFKGADATPDRLFSVTTGGSTPPVAGDLTTGAVFASSTNTTLAINGNCYVYGCTFTGGSGASSASLNIINSTTVNSDLTFDTCKLTLGGSNSGSGMNFGSGSAQHGQRIKLVNTTLKFSNTGQSASVQGGNIFWSNTASAIDVGGSLPTTLFTTAASSRGGVMILDGVDLSALTSKAIFGAFAYSGAIQVANSGLASGYTIGRSTAAGGGIIDLIVSDSSATAYNQSRVMYQGTLIPSTSTYNAATDGDTPISWAVTTTANCNPQSPFECFMIPQWVSAGTYAATKVQLTSATASLTKNDVWVETQYLGSSYPRASTVTTGYSPQLPSGTPTALDTAGASWATNGQGNNYDLQVPSFTTSADGYVRFFVKVGKPSLTVYIDPAITVA